MDVMLGVSVVGADARIALLDAAAPHDVIDQSGVDLSAEPISALASTLVSTDRMLAESGHRVVATRICDADAEEAHTLVNALIDADMTDVTAVARTDAVTAAVRSLAGGETVASLSAEGDTAALSIIDSGTDTTSLIAVEPIRRDDCGSAYRSLLERFSEEPGGATSVIVLGAPTASQWAADMAGASTVPLRFPDEPEFVLARGAALAALLRPSAAASRDVTLDAAETVLGPQGQQLAYSEVDDTGALDGEYGYAAADVPLQTPMRPLSAIDPEEVEAEDVSAATPRPKMLLLGSTVAAVVVVGFAALAVTVAISIRPTATQNAIRMQQEILPGKYFPVAPGQGVVPDGPNWTAVENVPPPGVDTGGVRTFETKALNLSGGGDAVIPRVIQIYRDGTVGVPNPQSLVPVPPDPLNPLNPDIPQAVPDFVPRLIPDLSRVDMNQVLSVLGNLQDTTPNVEAAQTVGRVVPLTDMVNPNNGLGLKDLGLVAAVPSNRGALFNTDQPKSAVPGAGTIPAEIFQTGKTGVDAAQVLPPDATVIEALPAPVVNGKPGSAPIFGSAIPDLGAVVPNPAGVVPGTVKPGLGSTPDVTGGLPDVLPKPDVTQQLPGVFPLPGVSPKPDVTLPGLSPKPDVTPQLPDVLPLPDLAPKPIVKAPVPDAPIQVPQVKVPDAPIQVPQVKIPDPPVSVPEAPVSVPEPVFKLPIPVFNIPTPAAPAVPVPEAPSTSSVPELPQIPLLPQLPFGGSGGGLFGSGSG